MNNKSKLEISINPQIELLMIVLLTSNYPNISKQFLGYNVMSEEKIEYIDKINKFFNQYSKHPIYHLLDEMIPNGFALGAPVEVVLSLDTPPKLEKIRAYSDFAIKRACGENKLNEFIKLLRDFAVKTDFIKFYNKNVVYYSDFLDLFKQETCKLSYVQILEDFYGIEQNSYNIYLTQLSKGSFGPSFINKNGKLDIYNICGFSIRFFDDREALNKFINNILWHEFSHPIINPLTEMHFDLIKKNDYTYEHLKQYKQPNAGYGLWDEFINEHIIRAIAIYLCRKYVDEKIANDRLTFDTNLGYIYIPKILEKIDYYNQNRSLYKDFADFYEELLIVFSERL